MTCKDCLCYELCKNSAKGILLFEFEGAEKCEFFKDKSKYVEATDFPKLVTDMEFITNKLIEILPPLLDKVVERFPYVVDETIKEYVKNELKELNE